MLSTSEVPLVITLPPWIDELVATFPAELDTDELRMELAIALSRRNVEAGGGPFGAAVFAGSRFIAGGTNRVLETQFSIAHAEIVTLMRFQQVAAARGAAAEPERYTLFTSTEPCCQCFGAIFWSGIHRLVCAATTGDAEAIGFDEGPKPPDWPGTLEQRGIEVSLGVRRDAARAVLDEYARRGGLIYGLRHPSIR